MASGSPENTTACAALHLFSLPQFSFNSVSYAVEDLLFVHNSIFVSAFLTACFNFEHRTKHLELGFTMKFIEFKISQFIHFTAEKINDSQLLKQLQAQS